MFFTMYVGEPPKKKKNRQGHFRRLWSYRVPCKVYQVCKILKTWTLLSSTPTAVLSTRKSFIYLTWWKGLSVALVFRSLTFVPSVVENKQQYVGLHCPLCRLQRFVRITESVRLPFRVLRRRSPLRYSEGGNLRCLPLLSPCPPDGRCGLGGRVRVRPVSLRREPCLAKGLLCSVRSRKVSGLGEELGVWS